MLSFLRKQPLLRVASRMFSDISKIRNIGVSAHIDSGKTTFSERVLYYAGKIDRIHEVKGSDGVGATMDFMELEREKGITIQSAATFLEWKDHPINLIDTPGHVDFTIEVERALRVLDGAVLLVCGVSGVQAQTYTVYKQMERYKIPRIVFINKLDRLGANPIAITAMLKQKLGVVAEMLQIPIGEDDQFIGLVDLIKMKAFYFEGISGEEIREGEVPAKLMDQATKARQALLDKIVDLDETLGEKFLMEEPITEQDIKAAIRRQCLLRKFIPITMGSAYKNKGVQLALDAVLDYLPAPNEKVNMAFQKVVDPTTKKVEEAQIELKADTKMPFVSLAFKLEENRFGQLTYCRVYQGKLKKGDTIVNMRTNVKVRVARMAKMHANKLEDIDEIGAGDIFALFGIDCSSGTTFTKMDKGGEISLSSMFVPDPVLSVSIKLKDKKKSEKLQKAMKRFNREDPTFTFNVDSESEELIISGMGELHLQIYAERLKREFEIDIELGAPTVNYRETISAKTAYNYLHKKQSGGAGQFARVIGYLEPINDLAEKSKDTDIFVNQFISKTVGENVPNEYIVAVEKQFYDSCAKGPLTGYPMINTRMVFTDGETHVVDSSANAFQTATRYAISAAFQKSGNLLEPIMAVEITVPKDMYSPIMNSVTKRKGLVTNTETQGEFFILQAKVPLANMFGFSGELRGFTQGQGEFSMEYLTHEPVSADEQAEVIKKIKKVRTDAKQT